MKVYHNFGSREFSPKEFAEFMARECLEIKIGKIASARILERKPLSNKGNALNGSIWAEEGKGTYFGLNIGQNPVGDGYKNYIPFLEEMGCRKIGPFFVVSSIIGKPIIYLTAGDYAHTTLRGYIASEVFMEGTKSFLEASVLNQKV